MRVTQQEIREILGVADVRLLHELNLAARYIDDVGFVAQLQHLQVGKRRGCHGRLAVLQCGQCCSCGAESQSRAAVHTHPALCRS